MLVTFLVKILTGRSQLIEVLFKENDGLGFRNFAEFHVGEDWGQNIFSGLKMPFVDLGLGDEEVIGSTYSLHISLFDDPLFIIFCGTYFLLWFGRRVTLRLSWLALLQRYLWAIFLLNLLIVFLVLLHVDIIVWVVFLIELILLFLSLAGLPLKWPVRVFRF